jgi:cytochrome c-type biogenesis protein CcmH/NrfF
LALVCLLAELVSGTLLKIVSMNDLGDFSETTSMQNYVKISQIFRCCKGQAEHLDLIETEM